VHETKDHSLAMFRDQLPQTTALLGAHLDLYQVHSATLESGVLVRFKAVEHLEKQWFAGVQNQLCTEFSTGAAEFPLK
jgi:hypothetical protein